MNGRIIRRMGLIVFVLTVGLAHAADEKQPSVTTKTALQNGDQAGASAGQPQLQRRNPRYQIGRGDVLDLSFPLVPEFNQTVTVQPDGYITLKGVGDLHVADQTVPVLTQSLKEAYAKILHDPIITVDLRDFEKPYFIANGQVKKPGKYDLRGDTTVMQAVAIAGGFEDAAKQSQILVFHRVSNDWTQVKEINVKQMLHAQNLSEDLHLEPGDMIFVPKSTLAKIKPFIPSASTGIYYTPFRP